ncbi:MAG: MarR family transcriptional regulator [Pseudomonadota bacterium]
MDDGCVAGSTLANSIDNVNEMTRRADDTPALAMHLDRLMRRIHADLRPKAMRVDDANVGPLGGMILMTIEENAPVTVQELARRLARDKGQMTRFVQSLERKSLLVRMENPDDRRVTLIELTQAGEALVAAFRAALAEVVNAMLVDVSRSERAQLLKTLQKLLIAPQSEA